VRYIQCEDESGSGKLRVERETEWVVGNVGCNGIVILILIIIIHACQW